ncbi:hypothetical protein LHFGNBLO_003785 [Mesorhizobium sp. AR10]|uniref:hypothetical protein n=1 Tax=Mesorhizobium sp. AR10 TaxID=2865839 RepID=UPI0021606C28|nr:hypothetical protein [Mesorhizobium sp. AR10]UVK36822.1 hypothetical protein LHFGNBLO_003785 [Mesorhizobium sp. AR10]
MADRSLDRFNANAPAEVRDAAIDEYIETGVLNHETAQVDEVETAVVQAAFTQHIERHVLKPVGLSMDQWMEHIDEAELPAFRRAAVEGNWQALISHARAAAKMRLDLGI